eukprot:m.59095 g.59095  ORF g.59095 m.59095 type:complete len:254 (-) comp13554_c1_seq1:895-1656(-)
MASSAALARLLALRSVAQPSVAVAVTAGFRQNIAFTAAAAVVTRLPSRGMAAKAKGGNKVNKFTNVSASDFSFDFDWKRMDAQMAEATEALAKEIAKHRVGKVSPSLLNNIPVKVGETTQPLPQVGQVSAADAQTLVVTVFDAETASAVEAAIRKSDLKVTPLKNGNVIKVPMPKMTQEHRANLAKMVKKAGEGSKERIRAVRQKAIKQIRDMKDVPEDESRRAQALVQKRADAQCDAVDSAVNAKVKEIEQE